MACFLPVETISGEGIQNYFRNQNSNNTQTIPRNETPRTSKQPSKCDVLGILTGRPKYRQYTTIDSRIKSFDKWPEGKTQDKKQLAEAGFAYTGVDDSVRCFYCSIGLRDWPEGGCPWEQHILASPACGHVIQCKGKAYVRKILGESDEDSDVEVDDSNEFVDTVKEATLRNEEAVLAAKEYCTDVENLNKAIKSLVRQDLQKKFTAVELVQEIQKIEEGSADTGASEHIPDNEDSDDLETDGEGSESEEEDLKETNRQLKDPVTCKICYEAIACIITLPCGHMISCSQCISALTTCAVCRAQIKGTVRALMAV